MKKALFIVGGLFLVLLASALVAPSLVDWNQYKGQVQSAVRSFTGKDVQIGGNLSLRIVPSLQISAADVRLANEEGWRAPYFLELDSLDVSAAFFPLLTGKVQVTSVTLRGARINLEINADGLGNWEALAGKSETKPGGKEKAGSGDGFQLDDFRIEGGEIVLSDSRRGTVEMITGIDAGLSAGSVRGPFHVDGGLTYRGQRISLKASLGRLFNDRRSPFNINLVLGGEEPGLGLSGSILFEEGRPILAGKMEVSGSNLGRLADALSGLLGGGPIDGINLAQAYSIKSKLAFGGGRVLLEEIELRVGKTAGSGKILIDFQEKIEGSASIRLNTVVVEDWLQEGASGSSGGGPTIPANLALETKLEIGAVQYGNGLARQVSLNGRFEEGRLQIESFRALLPGGASFNFDGALFGDGREVLIDGNLDFAADSLRALLGWLGIDVSAVPVSQLANISLKSRLRISPDTLDLIAARGQLDITRFNMSAAVGLGKRPYYAVNGSLDRMNISAYSKPSPDRDEASSGEGWAALKSSITDSLKPLAAVDVDIKLKAGQISLDGMRLQNLVLDGKLRVGTLTLRKFKAGNIRGLDLDLKGDITGLGGRPGFDLEVDIRAASLRSFLQAAGMQDRFDADAIGRVHLVGSMAGNLDDVRLNLTLEAATAKASLEGVIEGLGPSPRLLNVAFTLRHPDHLEFLKLLGLEHGLAGASRPLYLNASVAGSSDLLEVSGEFELLGGKGGLSGTVADPYGKPRYDVFLTASHRRLTQLVRSLGIKYNPSRKVLGEFSLAAALSGGDDRFELSGIEATLGPTRLSGDLQLANISTKPRLTGRLVADRFALDQFMPKVTAGTEEAKRAGGQRWSRRPMELGLLRESEADLRLTIGDFRYLAYVFKDVAMSLTLQDGVLSVPDLRGSLFGGNVEISASLNANGRPALKTTLALRRIRLEQALYAAAGIRPLTGQLNLNGAFRASGESQFQMISDLEGSADLSARNGVIRGLDVDRLSARLEGLQRLPDFVALLGTALSGGETPYSLIETRVVAKRGVLRMERIDGQISGATLSGQARVDLPKWNMGATAQIKLLTPADAPPIGVDITGQIDQPKTAYRTGRITNYMAGRLTRNIFEGVLPPGILPGGQPGRSGSGAGTPAAGTEKPATSPTPAAPVDPRVEAAKGFLKLLQEAARKKKKKDGSQ